MCFFGSSHICLGTFHVSKESNVCPTQLAEDGDRPWRCLRTKGRAARLCWVCARTLFPKLAVAKKYGCVTRAHPSSWVIAWCLCRVLEPPDCTCMSDGCDRLCVMRWDEGVSRWHIKVFAHEKVFGETVAEQMKNYLRLWISVRRWRPSTVWDAPCVKWKPLTVSRGFLSSATWWLWLCLDY